MRTILIIALLSLMTLGHTSASNMRFSHINSKDGLPHQQIQALAIDAEGNIWIGTRNGLSRYDGYSIKTYFHEQGNPRSLIHNFIYKLFVDSKNEFGYAHRMECADIVRQRTTSNHIRSLRAMCLQ